MGETQVRTLSTVLCSPSAIVYHLDFVVSALLRETEDCVLPQMISAITGQVL